ncbi:Zn(II)2Cys6 transcription factor [Aspergillus stella-maris]|uniref:Zn(II)2Cys6 transcription factor n=1 Tax=Aspergillus stella-maris TaxID=1810926 RepID=UPI003CCD7DE8
MGCSPTSSPNPTQHEGQAPAKRRQRREGGKWTRSGCLTCKRRRKRCDEAKPSCHNCDRLGLTCEGYGSMWAVPLGPAAHVFKAEPANSPRFRTSLSPALSIGSSGSSMGQTLSATDLSSTTVSTPLTEKDDLDGSNEASPVSAPSPDNQLAVASPNPSKHITHLSHLDSHYLQYHMEQGSKLLANLEADDNPLRSLLIPRALSSPILMNALCAVSAVHFSNRANSSWSASAGNEGANYYIETMQGLRTTLAAYQGQGLTRSFPDDAILAVSLLCKYEIVRGSVKQWAVHLEALQTLVTSRGGLMMLDHDTAEFVRGLFVYANNVAKITNRRLLKPKPSIPVLDLETFNSSITPKLDIYIGYTEELLKTCARISDLPLLEPDPVTLQDEVNAIDILLTTWTSTKTTYIIPKGMSQATLFRLRLVAEYFRDAAYIYLHSTLERASASPLITSAISTSKITALNTLLTRLKTHPIDHNCEFSALTSPLFIAGCELDVSLPKSNNSSSISEEGGKLILNALGTLETNFGIGNVKRAKEVLGIVWGEREAQGRGRERGRHWMDVLEGLGWDLILA